MVSLFIGDTITSYSNGKGKCILIATQKRLLKRFGESPSEEDYVSAL